MQTVVVAVMRSVSVAVCAYGVVAVIMLMVMVMVMVMVMAGGMRVRGHVRLRSMLGSILPRSAAADSHRARLRTPRVQAPGLVAGG